jgi:hypothetical protein
MSKLTRVLAVTAGLVGLGAVAGAFAGGVVGMLVGLIESPGDAAATTLIGAVLGAELGAPLLPIAGWLLMRCVPLGRALGVTMLGTIAGGLLGWFAPVHGDQITRTLWSGVVGFAIAVFLLRRAAARQSQTAAEPVPLDI